MMAVDLYWKEAVASVIWVDSSVVRVADCRSADSWLRILMCPLGRCVKAGESLWAEAVPTAAVQCKLRRQDLNPSLPHNRRKY